MDIKDNIWKFGVYSFIDNIRLVWMIWTVYYLSLGFTFTDIGIFEAIFAITIVLFELPSGAIADLIGKRKSLMIACFLNGIGFTAVGFMKLPVQFYLIALTLGIAFSFISGADIALLYDSVKKLKRQKEYKKIRGKITTYNQIALIFGIFVGPILFTIDNSLGFIITGIIYFLAGTIIFTMVEPYESNEKLNFKNHWKQTITSLRFTIKHKKIMWLIGFFFISTIGTELFFDFWQQPLLINNGILIKNFGILFGILFAIRGIISWFTHIIENKLNETLSLALVLIVQIILFIGLSMSNIYIMFLSFGLFYSVLAFQEIIFEDYINHHIPTDKRSTVLSIKSLIYNSITFGIYIIVGILMDTYPINRVLLGVAGFILIGSIVLFLFKKKI